MLKYAFSMKIIKKGAYIQVYVPYLGYMTVCTDVLFRVGPINSFCHILDKS